MRSLVLVLLLTLTACGLPANVVILIRDESGSVGKVVVREGAATAELDQPLAAVDAGSAVSLSHVFVAKQSDVDSEFAGALEATPRAPVAHILYFRTGLADLDPSSRGDLDAAIAAAKSTLHVDISVVGHADATGADAENQALSLRRAERVRDALVAAGISGDVIEIMYHGANNPRVPTPRGVPEPRNPRRGDHPLILVDTASILPPAVGDELQGIKRGVVELADLVLVNKADGELAAAARRSAADYASALQLLRPLLPEWQVPVRAISALEGTGIHEVWDHVAHFRAVLEQSGAWSRRRAEQARAALWSEIGDSLLDHFGTAPAVAPRLAAVEEEVIAGTCTPTAAARALLAAFLGGAGEKSGII
jgi:outer membrane protein OmpA-like peptidoglycan-associated protein